MFFFFREGGGGGLLSEFYLIQVFLYRKICSAKSVLISLRKFNFLNVLGSSS